MPTITLSTDKSTYVVGETVRATGFVSSDVPDGAQVDLKTGPRGGYVLASGSVIPSSGGFYVINYTIPLDVVGDATVFSEITATGTMSNFVTFTITTPATLTIVAELPEVPFGQPIRLSGILSGTVDVEGMGVSIVANGAIIGATFTNAAGVWSFDWTPSQPGLYRFHAAALAVAAFSGVIAVYVPGSPFPLLVVGAIATAAGMAGVVYFRRWRR